MTNDYVIKDIYKIFTAIYNQREVRQGAIRGNQMVKRREDVLDRLVRKKGY